MRTNILGLLESLQENNKKSWVGIQLHRDQEVKSNFITTYVMLILGYFVEGSSFCYMLKYSHSGMKSTISRLYSCMLLRKCMIETFIF